MSKQPEAFSFIERAIATAADEAGGRFAKGAPTFPVASVYPKLPEDNSQNQHAKVPDEPPLGWSVSAPVVVGEAFEVARSSPPISDDRGQQDAPGDASSPSVERPASTSEEIDDGCPGPRRPDGTPLSTLLPRRSA